MTRTPFRPEYDAVVGLEPQPDGQSPRYAFALVKRTFEITASGLAPAASEPLALDIHGTEALIPRLPPGSDYWVTKTATDVIIAGSAFAPEGKPARSLQVSAAIGEAVKRIAVFGRRELTSRNGRLVIGEPAPFVEMPLTYLQAYGGMDPRVPLPEEDREEYMQYAAVGAAVDHPGLYPRNPIGKGYLVYPEPLGDMEMPNLEDPDDLLTPERLVAQKPELWYRQPLPWSFEWTNWLTYPRELYLGFDAWYPCPDASELAEVRRGFFPASWLAPAGRRPAWPDELYQEASFGMIFRAPLEGAPVRLNGMHPERAISAFVVPDAPAIEIEIEGQRSRCAPRLTHLVIRPAENKLSAVWCAKTDGLTRVFLPGVHASIPLAAYVNGGPKVPFDTPPPIRDQLARASAAGAA